MKFLFKWALRLFLLAVVLVVVLALSKDWIIRTVAERRIAAATGMETHIGSLEVGVSPPAIDIANFKLYNSAEFGGLPFVDMPEFHMEYDPVALGAGKLHIKLLRLNLAEVDLVRNAAGQTNLTFLQTKMQPPKSSPAGGINLGQVKFAGIDTLNLTLGKFRYTDMAHPANDTEVSLNVQNIKSEGDLYGVAMLLMLKDGTGLTGQIFGVPPAK